MLPNGILIFIHIIVSSSIITNGNRYSDLLVDIHYFLMTQPMKCIKLWMLFNLLSQLRNQLYRSNISTATTIYNSQTCLSLHYTLEIEKINSLLQKWFHLIFESILEYCQTNVFKIYTFFICLYAINTILILPFALKCAPFITFTLLLGPGMQYGYDPNTYNN